MFFKTRQSSSLRRGLRCVFFLFLSIFPWRLCFYFHSMFTSFEVFDVTIELRIWTRRNVIVSLDRWTTLWISRESFQLRQWQRHMAMYSRKRNGIRTDLLAFYLSMCSIENIILGRIWNPEKIEFLAFTDENWNCGRMRCWHLFCYDATSY